MERVPKIGEWLPFFDDGKYSPSRHYETMVVDVISVEESKKKKFRIWNTENDTVMRSLYDIWRGEVDSHRNSPGFKVVGRGTGEPGTPYLYAEEIDCFVVCAIPKYDDCLIFFARTVDGGWFSMDVQSSWQGGELDVDLNKFSRYELDFPDEYFAHIYHYNYE